MSYDIDSGVPVVNRGYMWMDDIGYVYIAGGHFLEQG